MNQDQTLLQIIEKLEEESVNAYGMFLDYLKMLPSERTDAVKTLAKKYGMYESTVTNYRLHYNWERRLELVEAHKYMLEFNERQEATKTDRLKYVEQNRSIKDRGNRVSLDLLSLAEKLITRALHSDQVIEGDYIIDSEGRTVPTTTTIVMKSKVSDIAPVAKTAMLIQRMVNDLPVELLESVIPTQISEDLSLEELEAMQEENRKKMLSITGIQKSTEAIN